MDWSALEHIESAVKMPQGYRLERLCPEDTEAFIVALGFWFPDIRVGSECRFLDPDFYHREVFQLKQLPNKRYFLPILFRHIHSNDLAGCLFLEKNDFALTITSPMSAIATNHRRTGTGLSFLPSTLITEVGRLMGLELAYYISTLRSKSNQFIAEKTGYKLVGIIPGNDRDQVSSGMSARVFEAIYAKLLIPPSDCLIPTVDSLTETTQKLWNHIFSDIPLRGAP